MMSDDEEKQLRDYFRRIDRMLASHERDDWHSRDRPWRVVLAASIGMVVGAVLFGLGAWTQWH